MVVEMVQTTQNKIEILFDKLLDIWSLWSMDVMWEMDDDERFRHYAFIVMTTLNIVFWW